MALSCPVLCIDVILNFSRKLWILIFRSICYISLSLSANSSWLFVSIELLSPVMLSSSRLRLAFSRLLSLPPAISSSVFSSSFFLFLPLAPISSHVYVLAFHHVSQPPYRLGDGFLIVAVDSWSIFMLKQTYSLFDHSQEHVSRTKYSK
jgi:hypothetical protein